MQYIPPSVPPARNAKRVPSDLEQAPSTTYPESISCQKQTGKVKIEGKIMANGQKVLTNMQGKVGKGSLQSFHVPLST
eukprot:1155310-Pelagomonas_calceolata.AAC.5